MCFIALGAVIGPPVSGKINETSGEFETVGVYAGEFLPIKI